jgi:hypothetical protein
VNCSVPRRAAIPSKRCCTLRCISPASPASARAVAPSVARFSSAEVGGGPLSVYVLPLPVWPYANTVAL